MHKFICTLFVVAASVLGSWTAHAEATNASMTFYILSDTKVEGWHFIDVPNFPKLGYVASKPDLVVTNLKAVVVESHPLPALDVTFLAEDARKFRAMTEKAVGKRVVVMVNDKPVTVVNVLFPIVVDLIYIELSSNAEVKRTADDLKKLVR